jgi:hypothetical protein
MATLASWGQTRPRAAASARAQTGIEERPNGHWLARAVSVTSNPDPSSHRNVYRYFTCHSVQSAGSRSRVAPIHPMLCDDARHSWPTDVAQARHLGTRLTDRGHALGDLSSDPEQFWVDKSEIAARLAELAGEAGRRLGWTCSDVQLCASCHHPARQECPEFRRAGAVDALRLDGKNNGHSLMIVTIEHYINV